MTRLASATDDGMPSTIVAACLRFSNPKWLNRRCHSSASPAMRVDAGKGEGLSVQRCMRQSYFGTTNARWHSMRTVNGTLPLRSRPRRACGPGPDQLDVEASGGNLKPPRHDASTAHKNPMGPTYPTIAGTVACRMFWGNGGLAENWSRHFCSNFHGKHIKIRGLQAYPFEVSVCIFGILLVQRMRMVCGGSQVKACFPRSTRQAYVSAYFLNIILTKHIREFGYYPGIVVVESW